MRYPGRTRGASLLELGIIVSLIAILMVVATTRIWDLHQTAERVGVMDTLGALRSALGITVAARIAKGESLSRIAALQDSNPMALLKRPPSDYLGTLKHPDPAKISPHQWYFDLDKHMLIYRVAYPELLHSELGGPPRLRFRIALAYNDANGNGHFDPHVDMLRNIALVAVDPYRWKTGK